MLQIVLDSLDLIFPPRPTQKLVRACQVGDLTVRNATFKNIAYLCDYKDPLVQALIIENKYHCCTKASSQLATLLYRKIAAYEQVTVVPIPLNKNRMRARGYNQVENILSMMKPTGQWSYDPTLLQRTLDTKPQTQLQRSERIHNMRNAFTVSHSNLDHLTDSTVVIVDDVVTTGATLDAARATLAPHLPPSTKLMCLALAH